MSFPYLIPSVVDIDGVIDILTPRTSDSPIVILTESTIQLLDSQYNAPLSSHHRSTESLEKYGKNVQIRRNSQDTLIAVHTEKSFLLVYAVMKSNMDNSDDEVLSVYNSAGSLLQNGLVQSRHLNFFETNPVEQPIRKMTLRFKLFLKIAHGVVDFIMLENYEMMLATNDNVQMLDLEKEDPKVVDLEGRVLKVVPLEKDVVAIKQDGSVQLLKRGDRFTPMESYKVTGVTDCAVNEQFQLITFLTGAALIYYSYEIHEPIKIIPMANVQSLEWSTDGNTLVVLYKDQTWSLMSTFGCTMFQSGEHDHHSPWVSSIKRITMFGNSSLYSTDGQKVYIQRLLRSLTLSSQTNHDLKRQILISNSEIHIYTGHEMAISSSRAINWNIVKIPFDQYHQLPEIRNASISQDGKFLAVANSKALLIYSFLDKEWSFYQNDYSQELSIGHLTWFNKLNLLIVTTKTITHSELVMFDLRKFKPTEDFNSGTVAFKYDLSGDIILLNVIGDDIVMYSSSSKYYHFTIQALVTGLKIDLIKILNMDKVFKSHSNFRSLIKVKTDPKNHDMLILNNGELILLSERESGYQKYLLFDKIEYCYKISEEEYYMFNGEDLLLVKNFSGLIKTKDHSSTVLKVKPENYPLLLTLEKGLFVTMENTLIKRKSMEINSLNSKNSIFLHDLIRFELTENTGGEIYEKYRTYKNFPFALELLLYQTVTNDGDLTRVIELIKENPIYELNVVSKCLRKIEMTYWSRLLKALGATPQGLLQKCIELKEWKTLGILVIIFLNYDTENEVISIEEDQLIDVLKLLYNNAHDDGELWETSFEMLRFLKLLDPTGGLLKRSKDALCS
jgi:hypothetical protein